MQTTEFKLEGLTCAACAKLAVKYLKKINGVADVQVGADGSAWALADREISRNEIVSALDGSVYRLA